MGFLSWHYSFGVRRFLEFWEDFLVLLWRYFAVTWHLRTLFSPWKRDISKTGLAGFHPVIWLQNALENAVTRFLGAIVRSFVIVFALAAELFFAALGVFSLLIWIFLPVFLLSVLFVFSGWLAGNYQLALTGGVVFLYTLLLLMFSRELYAESKKNYAVMSLSELARENWFSRVWERVGKAPSESTLRHLDSPELLGRFLEACHLTAKEFNFLVDWELLGQIKKENKSRFWLAENLTTTMPLGRDWTFAYTARLDKYSTDLSEGDPTEYKHAKLVGHDQDLHMLELFLTRPFQNNVLIIGEAGIGRRTLVHALAQKIRSGESNPNLHAKRILELNLSEIISGAPDPSRVESLLRQIFFEAAYAGNIILVVNEIERFLKDSPASSKENISSVLMEFLNYPTFQIVGLTTPEGFHGDIEKNAGVMKFFETVQMGEASAEDALLVLFYRLKEIEGGRVIFTYAALKEIIKLAERYFSDAPFPEKALDLMEEVLLEWSQNAVGRYITQDVVANVVSQKIRVPVGEMQGEEKDRLIHLEEILHKRIVGQELAVRQIAETMRRARVGMASSQKPIGSFLFLGPTGVGKTESAKALAEAYFGNESRMVRLDMSEYQQPDSISRLMGSRESDKTGILVDKVKESPYGLLLLDEIEKAHPDILNLFLQILDEGWLTDAFGKKINFKNQIIIATSNAGAEVVKDSIEKNIPPEEIQKLVTDHVIKEGIFHPELLNRFEGVIFFHPLSQEDVLQVTEKLLANYALRLKAEKDISVQFEPDVVVKIAQEAFDPVFGARAISRYIEDKIGDNIVKKIIGEELKEGDNFVFGVGDLG